MNEQVEKILADVSVDTLTLIARDVIGDDSATLVGDLAFANIDTPHNDDRTIGIVKVSGTAVSVRHGSHHNWSSVVKIIDKLVPTDDAAAWGFPENEEKVYELGLFSDAGTQLRPARCYLTHTTPDGLSMLWLEDLSAAPQPPWTVEQFISTAHHLGQFNGYHFTNKTLLPFEIARDAYHLRKSNTPFRATYDRLVEIQDDPIVRRVFNDTQLELNIEYLAMAEQGWEIVKPLPHSLAFGDAHSRNLFPLGSETVGIDWASLACDPIGCDIGVLIGSPLSFGNVDIQLTTNHEREIYDSYVAGLQSTGWNGNLDHIRLGFFMHFSVYLLWMPTMASRYRKLEADESARNREEKRTSVALEDLPELKAHGSAYAEIRRRIEITTPTSRGHALDERTSRKSARKHQQRNVHDRGSWRAERRFSHTRGRANVH